MTLDRPKSAILKSPLWINIFSGFISRCMSACSYKTLYPQQNCLRKNHIFSSEMLYLQSNIYLSRLPPLQNSMIRQRFLSLEIWIFLQLTKLGCRGSSFRICSQVLQTPLASSSVMEMTLLTSSSLRLSRLQALTTLAVAPLPQTSYYMAKGEPSNLFTLICLRIYYQQYDRPIIVRVKFNILFNSITMKRLQKMLNFAFSQRSVEQLFRSRRLFYQATSSELSRGDFMQKYAGKAAYCGYDPTADSLHLGNLVSVIMMGRLSLLGLRPIFLIGGATGLIGDPSGKSKERALLDEKVVEGNISSIEAELTRVYSNIRKDIAINQQEYQIDPQQLQKSIKNEHKIRNNYDFYRNMDAVRYLRDVGKYFRMGPLLSRQTVANRLKSDQGISYAEFSYSIIQAYDFYRLFQQENSVLQFGGSDQWGNITNGCDLVRKKTNKQVFGITMPLLLTKNGQKFGKSEGNALFLNPKKTPIDEVHKYLLNSSDQQVEHYLHIFTFYSQAKIQQIMVEHNKQRQKRLAQNMLAQSVVRYLGVFQNKNKQFFTLSHEELLGKDRAFYEQLFQLMHKNNNNYHKINQSELKEVQGLAELLHKCQLAKSKSEVRRQVEKGGLYLNNRKVDLSELSKPLAQILMDNVQHGQFLLVRWGKKKYQFLHVIQ